MSPQPQAAGQEDHYLKRELYALMREDERLFDFLQSAALDGIWYWNLQRPDDEWMSPDFWRLFGIDPATQPHKSAAWQDLIFPEDRELALENFAAHCADPGHPYDQVVRYRHRDGSTVWVRCRGLAVRNDAGEPVRMLGAHVDLTALMRSREVLEQRTAELLDHNERLAEFGDRVAHDLQSPLGTLGLVADILKRADDLSGEATSAVGIIEQSIQRMKETVDGLLQYARTGTLQTHALAVSLRELIDELQVDLGAQISASNARLQLAKPATLHADPVMLRLILQNLLVNAIKYQEPGQQPQIQIRCDERPQHWLITVRDNGIGIPEGKLEEIFLPLRRAHGGLYQGTGIGLASSRRAAEAMGGRLWAVSAPGEGSTFTLELPRPA